LSPSLSVNWRIDNKILNTFSNGGW
jgi:hypothetical protein